MKNRLLAILLAVLTTAAYRQQPWLVSKTQTYLPWDSWQRPYVLTQPTTWFHEVFRQDDTPYHQREVDLIRELTGGGTPSAEAASPQ